MPYLESVFSLKQKVLLKDYYVGKGIFWLYFRPHQDAGQQVTAIWKTEKRILRFSSDKA